MFAAIGLPAMRNQCRRYAIAQVRAIVGDSRRAEAVRMAFADVNYGQSARDALLNYFKGYSPQRHEGHKGRKENVGFCLFVLCVSMW